MAQELRAAKRKTADMTNVKDRGPFNPKHMAEGDYIAKIVEVYETRNADDTKDMWVVAFQLQDRRDVVYPYYCTWDDSQLWKIRNVFVACGVAIPKKRVALDPSKIRNKLVGITLEDDEYNGKPKSVIGAVMSVKDMEDGPSTGDDEDDEDDVEEEEIEETPPPRKRRKKAPEPEPEDDDEEDEEEEDEDDEEEEEPEPPRRKKKASPSARAGGRSAKTSTRVASKKKRRVVEEHDDDDLDEMEVDEEDL